MTKTYQLKITLKESKPPIWRRIKVPGNYDLLSLNEIIQIAMGWTNSHLHDFIIDNKNYTFPDSDTIHNDNYLDEQAYKIEDVLKTKNQKFEYTYDFGDNWRHQIEVEDISDEKLNKPVCLAGKRNCPPEDCGGIWGYEEMLEAVQDPKHERHEELNEWLGEFDPEEFDIEDLNEFLSEYDPEEGYDPIGYYEEEFGN